MRTVWDNIQPITIRRASNGVVLVSDDNVTWGTANGTALDRAVTWAKATPARAGVQGAAADYGEFCKKVTGKVPGGKGTKRAQTVALFNAALAEFGLDDLEATLEQLKRDVGKPGSTH